MKFELYSDDSNSPNFTALYPSGLLTGTLILYSDRLFLPTPSLSPFLFEQHLTGTMEVFTTPTHACHSG